MPRDDLPAVNRLNSRSGGADYWARGGEGRLMVRSIGRGVAFGMAWLAIYAGVWVMLP